jgi:hypothetical protein
MGWPMPDPAPGGSKPAVGGAFLSCSRRFLRGHSEKNYTFEFLWNQYTCLLIVCTIGLCALGSLFVFLIQFQELPFKSLISALKILNFVSQIRALLLKLTALFKISLSSFFSFAVLLLVARYLKVELLHVC